MEQQGIDIRGAISRVRRELTCFRDECLPAPINPTGPADHLDELARPLRSRQGTVDRLLDALPYPATGGGPPPPIRVDYEEFLFQEVTASSHLVREGRIAWRIKLFVGWDWGAKDVLYRPSSGRVPIPDALGELQQRLPEARHWIMSRPVDESSLWNLLCVSLVPIADIDPGFAKLALDPETWPAIVAGDREIGEQVGARRLRVIDGYFHRVLNNALLHVIGALANNHSEVILDLLVHPDLVGGGYTSLMPHHVFAVLFEKVTVLHDIGKRGDR